MPKPNDFNQALDEAVVGAAGVGRATVDRDGHAVHIDVTEVGPIGVRITGISVGHAAADIARRAGELPERLRALPERVQPVEVDPGLGGAVLRTKPEEMQDSEFFEVEVRPERTDIRRYKVEEGDRTAVAFPMTRDQLERLIDEVASDD